MSELEYTKCTQEHELSQSHDCQIKELLQTLCEQCEYGKRSESVEKKRRKKHKKSSVPMAYIKKRKGSEINNEKKTKKRSKNYVKSKETKRKRKKKKKNTQTNEINKENHTSSCQKIRKKGKKKKQKIILNVDDEKLHDGINKKKAKSKDTTSLLVKKKKKKKITGKLTKKKKKGRRLKKEKKLENKKKEKMKEVISDVMTIELKEEEDILLPSVDQCVSRNVDNNESGYLKSNEKVQVIKKRKKKLLASVTDRISEKRKRVKSSAERFRTGIKSLTEQVSRMQVRLGQLQEEAGSGTCPMKGSENKPDLYLCPECGYFTTDGAEFLIHQDEHKIDNAIDICTSEAFAQAANAISGLDGEASLEAEPPVKKRRKRMLCKKSREPKKLPGIKRVYKKRNVPYTCTECNYTTDKKSSFLGHQSKHMQLHNHMCELCGYRSNYKCDLKRHQKTKHFEEVFAGTDEKRIVPKKRPTELKYMCDECGYMAPTETRITYHRRVHFTEKHYKCPYEEVCSYESHWLSDLDRHIMRTHKPETKPLSCPVEGCKFRGDRPSVMKRHSARHGNPVARQKNLVCDFAHICNYATDNKKNLDEHASKHGPGGIYHNINTVEELVAAMPYACKDYPGCMYRTSRKSDLRRHYRMHLGAKRHSCDAEDCNYRCDSRSHLVRHYLVKHKVQLPPVRRRNKQPSAVNDDDGKSNAANDDTSEARDVVAAHRPDLLSQGDTTAATPLQLSEYEPHHNIDMRIPTVMRRPPVMKKDSRSEDAFADLASSLPEASYTLSDSAGIEDAVSGRLSQMSDGAASIQQQSDNRCFTASPMQYNHHHQQQQLQQASMPQIVFSRHTNSAPVNAVPSQQPLGHFTSVMQATLPGDVSVGVQQQFVTISDGLSRVGEEALSICLNEYRVRNHHHPPQQQPVSVLFDHTAAASAVPFTAAASATAALWQQQQMGAADWNHAAAPNTTR